ncbi:hypothetical protein D3C73_1445630 [compost metagenome]
MHGKRDNFFRLLGRHAIVGKLGLYLQSVKERTQLRLRGTEVAAKYLLQGTVARFIPAPGQAQDQRQCEGTGDAMR